MKKLGLALLLSCFAFLFSFVPVFATEIIESVDVLSTTDSIFPLEVGDVIPRGHYVFNDDVSIDGAQSLLVYVNFSNMGDVYSQIFFSVSSSSELSAIAYRPGSDVWRGSWLNDSYRYIFIIDPIVVTELNIDYLSLLSPYVPATASSIFTTFDSVFDGFLSLFGSIVLAFWIPNEGLTFIGVLAVISLGIAISFLIFAFIRRFLKFRG